MFCGECGGKNEDGAMFCGYCGASLAEDTPGIQMSPAEFEGTGAPSPGEMSTGEAVREAPSPAEPVAPGKTMASTCPACGGGMVFDPTLGKLKCEFCSSEYTPEEVEAAWKEREKNAATTGVRADFGQDEMRSYACSACGAELMADPNTAVMVCPYCGNHTIAPAQFSGMLRPDYIIPFAHTKKEAEEKYLSFYNKRFLLPNSFKTDNHVQEIQGVYVPFWMFYGRVFIDGDYIAYDEGEDSDGNTHKSARFSVQRKGYLDYEKVPADASKRMDDNLMDSVEPYRLEELRDFSLTYLPGFLAERYDVSEEECRKRAHDRAEGSIRKQTRDTIKHDGIEESKEFFAYEGEKTHYAMLPVWMLTTRWNEKTFKFAMNGQTGKMVGDLPVSAPKMMAVLIPLFFGLFIATLLVSIFIGDTETPKAILTAFVVAGLTDLIVGAIMYSSMKSVHKAGVAEGYITKPLTLTYQNEKRMTILNSGKIKKQMKQKGVNS